MSESLLSAERFTWLASWPKSGNTFLRLLLDAYFANGYVDINDVTSSVGDNGAFWFQSVSPMPPKDLTWETALLLRPAALFNQLVSMHTKKRFIKTHCVNAVVNGTPHLIPRAFTERAVYIVRDPRDVVMSMQTFMNTEKGLSIEESADNMANNDYGIGIDDAGPVPLTTWSQHVSSWVNEDRYPVAVVRYEDLCADPAKTLAQVLDFCGIDPDMERCDVAAEVCHIAKLAKQEQEKGFKEDMRKRQLKPFFYKGGSRWRDELPEHIALRIERDHGEMMERFGYLEKIKAVG